MRREIWTVFAGFLAGLLVCLFFARSSIQSAERGRQQAQESHALAEARGDSLAGVAGRFEALAGRERRRADSLAARRVVVVQRVLAAPDSAARAMGIAAVPDTAGRRCISLPDFAELIAARAALPYCDSTTEAQARRAAAAESAAVTYHSAAVLARGDAAQLSGAVEVQAARAARAERRALIFGTVGAALGAAVVLLAGAAQ